MEMLRSSPAEWKMLLAEGWLTRWLEFFKRDTWKDNLCSSQDPFKSLMVVALLPKDTDKLRPVLKSKFAKQFSLSLVETLSAHFLKCRLR